MSETFEDSFIQAAFTIQVVPVLTDYRLPSETVSLVVMLDTFEGKVSQTLSLTVFSNFTLEQAFRKMFTDEYYKQPVYFPAYSWLLGLKEGIIYDLEILATNFCRSSLTQTKQAARGSLKHQRDVRCYVKVGVLVNWMSRAETSTASVLRIESESPANCHSRCSTSSPNPSTTSS